MRILWATGGAVAIAASVLVAVQSAGADETPTVEAPNSVAYLQQRYGVSEAEALRRLDLQRASTELAARLATQFPGEYQGMWLDQAGGGVLKVRMAQPEKLAGALQGTPDAAHIEAVPATQALKRVAGRDASQVQQKACDPRHCARAPMRGGIRIDVTRDDGTFGGCTTGFNLRSVITGRYYLLTAGHCVNGGRHQNLDKTFHELYGPNWPVTEERTHLLAENAYPLDYAVMPYQPGAEKRWFRPRPFSAPPPDNLVNFWCPGGCAGSHDVRITGYVEYAAIQVGWVVCATGSGYTPAAGEQYVDSGAGAGYIPGTRCGEIFSTESGGIDVHICARPGDSGSPLFTEADGKALGILSDGDPGEGPCTNPDERNYYAPVSEIIKQANTRTDEKFALVQR